MSESDYLWGSLPSGYLDTMNQQQSDVFTQLKAEILESEFREDLEQKSDIDRYILRFLRGTMKMKKKDRIFDLEEAKKALISTLTLRRKHKIPEILKSGEEPTGYSIYSEVNPTYGYKDTKAKMGVYIKRFGLLGTYAKMSRFTQDEWEQYLLYEMELREKEKMELMQETGVEAPGDFNIICEKGLGMGFLGNLKLVKMIAKVAADNSPESIYQVHIVNAPWIFAKLYNMVKGFVDADTRTKINIYNNVPTEFFRKHLDTSKLPKEYGGDADVEVGTPLDARK